jgi:hypothetical protein
VFSDPVDAFTCGFQALLACVAKDDVAEAQKVMDSWPMMDVGQANVSKATLVACIERTFKNKSAHTIFDIFVTRAWRKAKRSREWYKYLILCVALYARKMEVASSLVESVPELPVDVEPCMRALGAANVRPASDDTAESIAKRRQLGKAIIVAILPRAKAMMGPYYWQSLRKQAEKFGCQEIIAFVNSQHV